MYFRSRMYSTMLGRFISRDCISNDINNTRVGCWNPYEAYFATYCSALDPEGRDILRFGDLYGTLKSGSVYPASARLIRGADGKWKVDDYSALSDMFSPELLICLFYLESKFNTGAKSDSGGNGLGQMTESASKEMNRFQRTGPSYPSNQNANIVRDVGQDVADGFRNTNHAGAANSNNASSQIAATVGFLATLAKRDGTSNVRDILKKYGPGDAGYGEYADVILQCETCLLEEENNGNDVPMTIDPKTGKCLNCLEMADLNRNRARASR